MSTSRSLRNSPLMSDSPKFCTVILFPEDNDLKIEHEFARRHGRDLPRTVWLKFHGSDKLWKVEVVKSGRGEVLFRKGWNEFKRNYSVAVGDFMVFKFDESSSMFDVFIYDMACVHIECKPDVETSSESDDASVEISGDDDDVENDEEDSRFISEKPGGSGIGKTRKFARKLTIHEVYTLRLPKVFSQGIGVHSYVMLKDEKERELKVSIVGRGKGKYVFGAGWRDFLLNNKVTIGSKVSFEFVSAGSNVVEVVVVEMATGKNMLFEYVKKRNGRPQIVIPDDHSRENPGKVPINVERGNLTENEDTDNVTNQEGGSCSLSSCSFRRKISFSSKYRIELGKEFIASTGISSHQEIILKNVEGRMWPVQNTCREMGRCTLGSGWHDFLVGNNVVVESTLEFKLSSNSRPCTIEVQVVKLGPNRNVMFKRVK